MAQTEEALSLITRYLDDPENENLQQELHAFRQASAENEAFFIEIKKVWDYAEKAGPLSDMHKSEVSKRFKRVLKENTESPKSVFIWVRNLAASLILLAFGYWLYQKNQTPVYLSKITGNHVDSVKLSDGSFVRIAKNSEFRYPVRFNGSTREVALIKGQAFFEITKDKKHPFKVNMNESNVTVLGTSFNIHLSDTSIVLGVKTGKVQFLPYKNAVASILTAGQAIAYDVKRHELESRSVQNQDAWIKDELIFVDTSLDEVCKQLSTYYGIEIELDDHKHKAKKLNAHFKNQPLEDVLMVLTETYNLKIKKEPTKINLITPKQIN